MPKLRNRKEYLADIESNINALSEPLFMCYKNVILYNITTDGTNYSKNNIVNFSSLVLSCDNNNNTASSNKDVSFSINNKLLSACNSEYSSQNAIEKEAACEIIAELFYQENPLFVTYNAQLSMCFINKFFETNGITDAFNNVDILDLLSVYRDRNGFPCKLTHAIRKYNLIIKKGGPELHKVNAYYELLKALIKERDDLSKYVNIFGYVSGEPVSKFSNVTYVRFKNDDSYTRLYERISI